MSAVHAIEVAARIGAMILHAAAAKGVDPAALRAATGFDPAVAADPDARIPLAVEEALWDEAARLSGDEAFGLHAAGLLRPGVFDVLDYAIRTAPTLRVSLERLARYNRLEHDVAVFETEDRGDVVRVEHAFRVAGRAPNRHASDFTIASIVVIGAQIAGEPVVPRRVELRHDAPSSAAAYARVFGVPVVFSAPVNAIELPSSVLDRPLAAADPGLSRVIERHAEALLAARPDPVESTAARVRRIAADALGEGDASLRRVAERLKTSERSLQRRLADEGVTFDAVLDDLRRELALRYLGDRKLAIAEVAYLLGYSEPSAFHRAFKRWTGATPSEVRRRAA